MNIEGQGLEQNRMRRIPQFLGAVRLRVLGSVGVYSALAVLTDVTVLKDLALAQEQPTAPEQAQQPEAPSGTGATAAPPSEPAVTIAAPSDVAPQSPPVDTSGASGNELAKLRAEIEEIKAKQAEAEMAALMAEEPAEVEDDTYRLYGFMDMGAHYYAVDKSSLVGAVFDTNALTFVTGNIDLYFDFNPIEDWRALAEIRFTNAPQGDVVSYGGLAGDFNRVNVEQFDPHGTAPNAPMWGGYAVIEQAWIEWGRHQQFKLRAGSWFTPFGIWNVDHGSPTLLSMAMPQFIQQKWMPLRQTGLQALGSFFSGETEIAYRAWVSNGRTEQNPFDYDNEKSFGARLFVKRDTGTTNFQVGATYHHGKVRDKQVDLVAFSPARFETFSNWEYVEDIGGLDVSVDMGDTRIRAEGILSYTEYAEGKQASAEGFVPGSMMPNRYRVGGYLLAAHQLPWLGMEPYLYAELIQQPWLVADGLFMPSLGMNVHFNPSALLKLQYAPSYFFNWKHETPGDASINNMQSYMGRLVVAF